MTPLIPAFAAAVLGLASTVGCAAAAAERLDIVSERTLAPGDGVRVDCLTLRSNITLSGDDRLGGLSGFRVEGDRALFVADNGWAYRARIERDDRGWIEGLAEVDRLPLTDRNGQPYARKSDGDAEGLALKPDGGIYVSFEGRPRVLDMVRRDGSYRIRRTVARDVLDPLNIRGNEGIEAIEILSDGRLIMLAEKKDESGFAPGLLGGKTADGDDFAPIRYRPRPDFSVTDATVDPKTGDLFVLERAFSVIPGPRMALSRVPAESIEAGADLVGERLGILTLLEGVDNMEGLVLERTDDGSLRAHIVSDDNFNVLQRTIILGLEIAEPCLRQRPPSSPAETGTGPDD